MSAFSPALEAAYITAIMPAFESTYTNALKTFRTTLDAALESAYRCSDL